MTSPDRLIELKHADPETIEGVPTNEELIELHDLGTLSNEVRSGYLQMWHTKHVRETILNFGYAEVNDLYDAVSSELEALKEVDRRIRDLRFLSDCLSTAKNRQIVYRADNNKTPFGMPKEVFWDKQEGAGLKRAQWVVDNLPWVSIDEITQKFALQPDQIEQLELTKA